MDGHQAKSKVVLAELGFVSVWSFVRASGVSHISVSDLLYKPPENRRQLMYKLSTVMKIFEALTHAYKERQASMDPGVRKICRIWIQGWIDRVLRCDVRIVNMANRSSKNKRNIQQREWRLKKRRAQLARIAGAFQ